MNHRIRSALLASLAIASADALAGMPAWQLDGNALPRESAQALSIAAQRVASIHLADETALASAEELEFSLFDRNVVARRTSVQRTDDGWTWSGQIGDEPGHFVVLTASADNYAGLVSTHEGNFEIRPDSAGKAHLIELDTAAFPACAGAVEAPPSLHIAEPASSDVTPLEPTGAATVTIDVMILYTNTLLSAIGGVSQMRAQAQAAVAASNTAFANSQMTTRLNLVAILPSPIDENAVGSNINSAQLASIRDNAQIQALRNQHGADLVGLLVDDGSTGCGIGYVMRSPGSGFASSGYQITASGCAVGNLSYVHEHGHNLGMEHDPANGTAPANASYPWSFGHIVNGSFRTVMSYSNSTLCPNGCTRRAYFSNPAVNFSAAPTGIDGVADNHRTGNSTGPIAAAFRVSQTIFRNGFDSTP